MSIKVRSGEKEKSWFRHDRCFFVDGKWFFATREGENIGPFNTRLATDHAVALYIKFTQTTQPSRAHVAKLAKNGLWSSTLHR